MVKKVKKDAYKKSVLTDDLEHCLFCGHSPVHFHHIFGGSNRYISTEDDMIAPLCWECHMNLHSDPNQQARYRLMREAQEKWEQEYFDEHADGSVQCYVETAYEARTAFIKRYGKSYL